MPRIDDITSDDVINISEVDSGIYLSGYGEKYSRIVLDWKDSTFITYADVFDRWELFISSDELYPLIDSSVDISHDITADYQYVTSEEAFDTVISVIFRSLLLTSLATHLVRVPLPQSLTCYHLIQQFFLMNFLTQLFSTLRPELLDLLFMALLNLRVKFLFDLVYWTVDIDQDGHWY